MKKHFKIFSRYFRLNLASALEYRAAFFTQAFGMALSNSSFIFFWWIAFEQIGGTIAGYSFEEVLFIWAVASSAFGLANILFANTSKLTQLIISGELDTFLLQPCNILLNIVCARTNLSAYGDLLYGFVIMFVVYMGNGAAWICFFASLILGTLLLTAISLSAHTLSFYWGDASMIGSMAIEFAINFSIYPEKIYAPIVRAVMYSLVPVGFFVHIPLGLLGDFSPLVFLLTLAAAILYCSLACLFFYRGLRRYESGNVIVTKM